MAQAPTQAKFKVLKALGKGSYGTVYKVQRLADGGVYAMKETDLGRMGHKEKQDAVNEIRVLGSMAHPNVVRHHETFLAGNKLCIVMEYAGAGDLAGFIKEAAKSNMPLPEATVWRIFLQLCQGMHAIHETCVIHRDIKPANIFMCPESVVKVGDLGVAKALNKANYAQTCIGTPVFMAPEVWRGLRYAYSSDLWSLGGVLYEMMTYRLPFEARSLNELKNKIIMSSFPPIKPGAPYSPALVAVCHALLNKDPNKRPTCAAILNSREAAPWLHTIPEPVRMPLPPLDAVPSAAPLMMAPPSGAANPQLLPTIVVPRDIRLLPRNLPKPSYDDSAAAAAAPAAAPTAVPSSSDVGKGIQLTPRQQQQQQQSPLVKPSPRDPSPRGYDGAAAAGANGGGAMRGPAGGVAQKAAAYEAQAAAAAAGGGIAALGGMRNAAGGVNPYAMQKPGPYGAFGPNAAAAAGNARRVPSAGVAAAAAGQRVGGVRPPSGGGARPAAAAAAAPGGGVRPPSAGSKAAAVPSAAAAAAGMRVPSAGIRAAAAGAYAGAGNQHQHPIAARMAAAGGARQPVRRGFY